VNGELTSPPQAHYKPTTSPLQAHHKPTTSPPGSYKPTALRYCRNSESWRKDTRYEVQHSIGTRLFVNCFSATFFDFFSIPPPRPAPPPPPRPPRSEIFIFAIFCVHSVRVQQYLSVQVHSLCSSYLFLILHFIKNHTSFIRLSSSS
jgi:hypothetical protein